MKVQLVVVQGRPEGKSIPLAGPSFKIGRGEGCHLRPQSDLVSREHAEFQVVAEGVILTDLGSRNGTEVNGKKLAAREPQSLNNGDLVKIGTLTFAVAIEGAVAARPAPTPIAATAAPSAPKKPRSLDDVSGDEIDAWLVSDAGQSVPDRPSGVYGGDTMTISTYTGKAKSSPAVPTTPPPAAAAPRPAPVEPEETAEEPEAEPEAPADEDMGFEDLAALQAKEAAEADEEFVDESNPFYAAKKAQASAATPAASAGGKSSSKDSSDAAGDILRKMMDRRKARS